MAGINFGQMAPGIPGTPMLPGWMAVRPAGMGDIVNTSGFTVPDRDMRPSVEYRMGVGELVATQGFSVPNRDMNPVADYVSGNVKPLGQSGGCGCACGGSTKGSLNGIGGVGDIAADFAAIQSDFTTGNYSAILTAPIMGIPYAIPIALAAIFVLPSLLGGGSGGGRRRR